MRALVGTVQVSGALPAWTGAATSDPPTRAPTSTATTRRMGLPGLEVADGANVTSNRTTVPIGPAMCIRELQLCNSEEGRPQPQPGAERVARDVVDRARAGHSELGHAAPVGPASVPLEDLDRHEVADVGPVAGDVARRDR